MGRVVPIAAHSASLMLVYGAGHSFQSNSPTMTAPKGVCGAGGGGEGIGGLGGGGGDGGKGSTHVDEACVAADFCAQQEALATLRHGPHCEPVHVAHASRMQQRTSTSSMHVGELMPFGVRHSATRHAV